jgi:hypothetical protein
MVVARKVLSIGPPISQLMSAIDVQRQFLVLQITTAQDLRSPWIPEMASGDRCVPFLGIWQEVRAMPARVMVECGFVERSTVGSLRTGPPIQARYRIGALFCCLDRNSCGLMRSTPARSSTPIAPLPTRPPPVRTIRRPLGNGYACRCRSNSSRSWHSCAGFKTGPPWINCQARMALYAPTTPAQ